jgi:hypothetical protein
MLTGGGTGRLELQLWQRRVLERAQNSISSSDIQTPWPIVGRDPRRPHALEMAKWRPAGPFCHVGLLVGCLQEMHVHGQTGPLGQMSCGFEPTVRKPMGGLTARSRSGPGDRRGIKGRVLNVGWAPSGPNP